MRKSLLLILLTVVAVAVLAAATWQMKSETVMSDARGLLEQEVMRTLGSEVRLGAIELEGVSGVAVNGISLFDKQGKLLAAAERLRVAFNPLLLLTGKNPLDAIHSITVESPRLYLRQRSDMAWNVSDLTGESQSGGQQFGAPVYVHNGFVAIESQQQGNYQFEQLDGVFDFRVRPSIRVEATGMHNGSGFSVAGSVNGNSRDALTVTAGRLDLPVYQALLPSDSVSISSGLARNVSVTLIREKETVSYSGEAIIENVSGQADKVPVSAASALVAFDQDTVRIYRGQLRVWDQPLQLSGSVVYRADQPVFDLELQATAFASEALPLEGIGGLAAFSAHVKGTRDDFRAQGDLRMESGQYRGYLFSDAATQFVYSNDMLQLTAASAAVYGGRIAADGMIDLSSLDADLRISGRQLDGAALAVAAGMGNSGAPVDFDMLLRGQLSLEGADAAVTVTLGGGSMAGVGFSGGYGGFHLRQGVLTIDYLNAGVGDGMINAAGNYDISRDQLELAVDSYNLPLAELTQPLPANLRATGSLRLAARLSGSLNDPQASVSLTARHGSIVSQPFERLSGTLRASREGAVIESVELLDGRTTHTATGEIGFSGDKKLALTVITHGARMETLLKPLALPETVTGNVEHTLLIGGTLDQPQASGHLTLTDGSWRGYLLDRVSGGYQFHDGVLTLEDTEVKSLDNHLRIDGTVAQTGQLALEIKGSEIDLARLPFPYLYPVNGRAELAVRLTGTVDAPQLAGQATIPLLSANGQAFEQVQASIRFDGSMLEFPSATLRQGDARFELNGGIDLASEAIYGSMQVEKAQASALAALADLDAAMLQGAFSGYFTWNGALRNPDATFSGLVENGVYKDYTIGDIEVEAALTNHVIELNTFMVRQNNGLMAAKGRIDLNGDIDIEAGARDIDAAFFAKLFDASVETKGRLSFTAQMSGKTSDPHTALSLEISDGSIDNAGFDRLYGLFVLDLGKVQINQLLLSKGDYRASAYGVIPLAALNREKRKTISAEEEMDLTLRLDHANLSILPFLSNAVSSAAGETQGEVKVSGSVFEPKLNGQITVTDGVVKFIDVAEPIQKVTVDIQLKDDTIQLRTFEGTVGAGKYRLSGSATVRDMALHDYNLALSLDQVALTHKYFKGPLNGNLTLSERNGRPHLAGSLLIANSTLNVPLLALAPNADTNFDLGLDVELAVGDKVRLYDPMLYDVWVTGKVHFDGSLRYPDASGKFESLRGTLNYLQTRFRINEASVAFTQFRSLEPVINLNASARLQRTNVNLAVTGPVTAMDLRLTSDPAMSQQEILSLLTLREKFTERQASGKRDTSLGRDELVGMLDTGLQLRFFSEIEDMFRNSLGVDEFRVFRGESSDSLFLSDRTTTDQDQYKIEIGKYVNDRLLLRYTTGIESSERTYGARYDLSRSISLSADIDEFNEWQLGIGMRFRF
ncbi:MAG: translocation/assembly module TamB domain-containing protein [Sporomusaceae bacterium]|nr:translocation/assembly module TamB domain-containing protein [Sporomusaceae bacterium]